MKNICLYIALIAGSMLTACSDMNDLHDKYLKDGETIYLAKFDSISLHSGRNRVMMEYWLSDPKAKKCLIAWDLGESHELIDVSLSEGGTPNVVYIDNLKESAISFEFTSCTEDLQYQSLKTSVTCSTYGDRYFTTLLNATVKKATYDSQDNELTITWSSNYENVIGYSIRYATATGDLATVRADVNADKKVVLENFPPQGGSFEYAAIYLPDEGAIDEFQTGYSKYIVE